MSDINRAQILDILASINDPVSHKNLVAADMISGLAIKDSMVQFSIEIGDPSRADQMEPIRKQAEEAVRNLPGVISVTAILTAERAAQKKPAQPQPQKKETGTGAAEIRHIIAVASGKGGVGKSTTAVNLALALKSLGLAVGMMDADVFGPSQPRMMGISGRPASDDGKTLEPMENFGVKSMSMGFLVAEDQPVVWRGPMVMGALQQMLNDVNWGPLDVLVVDMPPGTGDAQLSMSQNVPLAGAVIVSTPQDIALLDARKGLNMFKKVDVPVLGLIENMSYFLCPKCGEQSDIFGHGGARDEAERIGADFLGEIPLHMDIRTTSDGGNPIVVSDPESAHAKAYMAIAEKVWGKLSSGEGQPAGPKISFS
ncbi:iron-sulfur cluster carrier protein ApbC [Aestuariispira insulae]|uniref:Iron-sulfur cluster carrier protein n=1 Tax=Aestuariispira insulae TaxID=1461337 RepID=A0A3D9HXR7_9PROT|nr:iron-sulfur cluster carrier protein ApbC [Aestuariispira insulae]RED54210.1 ATP-binding protein involved in chromosome partitioning [Aestuariispira insulae]